MFKPFQFSFCRILLPAALLSCAWFAAAPQIQAQGPSSVGSNDVVLTVGNRKITMEEFEKIAAFLPPQFAGAPAQMGKRGFADE